MNEPRYNQVNTSDFLVDGDTNPVRALLKDQGRKRIARNGIDPGLLSRTEVRQEGARELGRKVAIGAVALLGTVVAAVGFGELVGYAADHTPVPTLQQQMDNGNAVPQSSSRQLNQEQVLRKQ